MRRRSIGVPLVALALLGAGLAPAERLYAAGDLDPRIALHIVPDVGGLPCEDPSLADLRCETIQVVGDTSTSQRMYLVVTGMPDGIRSVSCSIRCSEGITDSLEYCLPEGVAVTISSDTSPCLTDVVVEFTPDLPARGPDGLVIVGYWTIAKGSGLYAFTGGTIDGAPAHVVDPTGHDYVLLGSMQWLFGVAAYEPTYASVAYNPCESLVPVAETTWGSLKALYE